MTLLANLFSKKSKSKSQDPHTASTTTNDESDPSWSPTASYVTPDTHGPSVPNGRSYLHPESAKLSRSNLHSSDSHLSPQSAMPSSSNKLKLPFGRKKSSKPLVSGFASAPEDNFQPPDVSPRPPFYGRTSTSSALSDVETTNQRLGPPPSKSAIFAAYADPNSALSTRSLPNDSPYTHSETTPPPHVSRQPKRPSLFAWGKSTPTKSTIPLKDEPTPSPGTSNSDDPGDSSFNLKSFRHVMPSPSSTQNISHSSLATPTPRPRGESVYSDSSQQRISVAAFREAQARRSMAGSPSPSMGRGRSPSPLPPSPAVANGERDRGRSGGPRPSRSSPNIPQNSPSALQQNRKSGMSLAATSMYTSDSDESEEPEEEDDSDDGRAYAQNTRLTRRGTVKSAHPKDRLAKSRAKSELGHGSSPFSSPFARKDNSSQMVPASSKSHLGHGDYTPSPQARPPLPNFQPPPPSWSQSSLGDGPGPRPRASNSTSALNPSAAAKRASILVAANAANDAAEDVMQYKRASRHIRDSSVHSNPGEPPSVTTAKKAASHHGHGGAYVSTPSSSNVARLQQAPQHQRQAMGDLSDDSDSDNAPLATLMAPRRPGSAMSSYSNASLRSTGGTPLKPLIDIKQLTGGNTPANKWADSTTLTGAGKDAKSQEGFTGGRTLLAQADAASSSHGSGSKLRPDPTPHQAKPRSASVSVSQLARSHSPMASPPVVAQDVPSTDGPPVVSPASVLTSKTAPFKFVSPPGTPQREVVKTLGTNPPPRSATMPFLTTSTPNSIAPSTSPAPSPESRRDALSERLERVVKRSATADSTTLTSPGTASPAPGPSSLSAPVPTSSNRSVSPGASPLAGRAQAVSPSTSFIPAATSVSPPPPPRQSSKPSPPDQSLADLLGAGIRLISLTGESDDDDSDRSSDSDSDSDESEDNYGYDTLTSRRAKGVKGAAASPTAPAQPIQGVPQVRPAEGAGDWEEVRIEPLKEEGKIVPIPIKQRTPLPSFSVTSRPQHQKRDGSGASTASGASSAGGSQSGAGNRESVASSYSLFGPSVSASASSATASGGSATGAPNTRKRSSTLIPTSTTSSTLNAPSMPSNSSSTASQASSGYASGSSHNRTTSSGQMLQGQAVGDRQSALRALGSTPAGRTPPPTRQRSSTMVPAMPQPVPAPQAPSITMNNNGSAITRPFAMRRDSPASSTGDSSSGRAPLTPRDGSDIGVRGTGAGDRDSKAGRLMDVDQYSGGASGLGIGAKGLKAKHIKRRSVSFEEDMRDKAGSSGGEREKERVGMRGNSREFLAPRGGGNGGEPVSAMKKPSEQQLEERRKERRREEAKAAIELGNVINGPGPVMDDDDDDLPINQLNPRMSTMNPMMMSPMGMQQPQQQMGFGPQGPMSPAWGMNNMNMPMNMPMMNNGMLSPAQFMVPPPPGGDPSFIAAHQQAMMIAKQAYQMAVAQQALAAAADEWERSSNVGGFGGGSVYGGSTMGAPSVMMNPMQYGMMGQMGAQNNWSTGSGIFPSSRSMYGGGISSSRSDYGGGMGNMGGGGGMMNSGGGLTPNWSSSRSSYGDMGPSTTNGGRQQRDSTFGGMGHPPMPASGSSGKVAQQRMRTTSQPANPQNRGSVAGAVPVRRAPPPSSWKQQGY